MKGKKYMFAGALAFATLIGATGGTMINALQANAADTKPAVKQAQNDSVDSTKDQDPSEGGHVGENGVKEELLTGDVASKVKAAALAEVKGGSIDRVETDAEGATYEAHMKKSDGSRVTVKLDSNFKVTGTENGMR